MKNIKWVNNYNHGFRYHYVVDEDKKQVSCIMEARYSGKNSKNCKGADMFVYRRLQHELASRNVNLLLTPKQTFNDKIVKGTATCSYGDTWDVDKGRRIAYHKALKKLSTRRMKELVKLSEYYNKVAQSINDIVSQQEETSAKAENILHKIL